MFIFQTGTRHVYLTPKGSITTSYGSVELEDDLWHPWCFDCRLSMPGKGNSGSAMFDMIKHRRTVHDDDLKLVRKLGQVRIRPA